MINFENSKKNILQLFYLFVFLIKLISCFEKIFKYSSGIEKADHFKLIWWLFHEQLDNSIF